MSKLTHDFGNALWRVRRETGTPLSLLHKTFMRESLGGSRAVSSYRFRQDVCANYQPVKQRVMGCHLH
ncbi:MAG: hypothetical protein HYS17_10845 [Micavibrio aeruginosavorus]|uniref:Uncharacterized protein n=1 Tax=Micavibrio aeruginosavorus TaxID=349221 RepID=A0A7T5R206_9BACT|nr:MAG: hypothetical protein HYS17_10845 [Micavibrio aeruginosavorus]